MATARKFVAGFAVIGFALNVLSTAFWYQQDTDYYWNKLAEKSDLFGIMWKVSFGVGLLLTVASVLNVYKWLLFVFAAGATGTAAAYCGLEAKYFMGEGYDLPIRLLVGFGGIGFYALALISALAAGCTEWIRISYSWTHFVTILATIAVYFNATVTGIYLPYLAGEDIVYWIPPYKLLSGEDTIRQVCDILSCVSVAIGVLVCLVGINDRNKYLLIFFALLATAANTIYLIAPMIRDQGKHFKNEVMNSESSKLTPTGPVMWWYYFCGFGASGLYFLVFMISLIATCCCKKGGCCRRGSSGSSADSLVDQE